MGIIKSKKLIVLFSMLLFALSSNAQSEVEHTIVKGNTLYKLAKEYGSTVEAIYEANPQIGVRSLVIGETLIIPIKEKEVVDSSRYIFHTVRSFESVYGISNKYELKDSTVYWHNPVLKNSPLVQKGQVLKIPKHPDSWKAKSGEFDSLQPQKKPHYIIYVVKPGDSPESLAKDWGFEHLEEFYALNPDTRYDWWVGMNLVRPVNKKIAQREFNIKDQNDQSSAVSSAEKDTLTVVSLLPFFIQDYVNEGPRAARSLMAFSFRQGVEYAIKDFQERGMVVEHLSFDTYNNTDTLKQVQDKLAGIQPNIILGPVYSSRVMQFKGNEWASRVVSPLSKNEALTSTGAWISIVHEEEMINAIKADYEYAVQLEKVDSIKANIPKLLIVGLNQGKSRSKGLKLRENIASTEVVLIENDGSWAANEALTTLDTAVKYKLVITENDPAFVLDVIRNLRGGNANYHWLATEYQIFDNGLVNNVFAREEVTVYTSSYIDYQSLITRTFVQGFRDMFGREPDRWAIEGYDNAYFHLQRLLDGTQEYRGIKKGFNYPSSGKQNEYVERRSFKNLRWELVP